MKQKKANLPNGIVVEELKHNTIFNLNRSLVNNKMSLTEVEALGDLLEAETNLQLEICQYNLKVNQ